MGIFLFYQLVFVVGIQSATVSLLTDEVSQNSTSAKLNEVNSKNVDVFRQLLNQETIIRMTMVKNVHALMKDMLTLQENLAEADDKISVIRKSTDQEISELKKQVERLKKENDALKNSSLFSEMDILKLKENLQNVSSTLTDVKIEVRYLSITLLDMKTETKDVETGFKDLNKWKEHVELEIFENGMNCTAAISELEARHLKSIDDINNISSSLRADIDQFENNQLRISASVSALELFRLNMTLQKCGVPTKIGFTAGVSTGSSSWNSGTLVFPSVITNVGNGYNPSDGVFTAPVAGVYVFFVNVQSYNTKAIYVDIVLNGKSTVRTMAETSSDDHYDAGPNLAVLSLQTGDRVWVKRYAGQGYYAYSDAYVTTFSGFLI